MCYDLRKKWRIITLEITCILLANFNEKNSRPL